MGFSAATATLISSNKNLFKGKSIISLGNPFGAEIFFEKYISRGQVKAMLDLPRNARAHYLFTTIFEASSFQILDISNAEGAEHIYDLNLELNNKALRGGFDIVLDFGTQEHVFDNITFLSNVFFLLALDGYYIFDLPANNWCEHGFRQYSPTFFFDFCSQNRSLVQLVHLGLWSSRVYLDTLPLYRKLDLAFDSIVSSFYISSPRNTLTAGRFTGVCISLFNHISLPSGVIGVIKNNGAAPKALKMAASQCLYRNFSLEEVLPNAGFSGINTASVAKFCLALGKMMIRIPPPRMSIWMLSFIASNMHKSVKLVAKIRL